jgi:hypothetical protein
MKNKPNGNKQLSEAEIRLVEQLREHPEILARVQSILALTSNAQGPLMSADQVEQLLIQEMRQLGNTTMKEWATGAEERVSNELKGQDATVRSRKKKH